VNVIINDLSVVLKDIEFYVPENIYDFHRGRWSCYQRRFPFRSSSDKQKERENDISNYISFHYIFRL